MGIENKRPKKQKFGIPSQISGMAGVYYVAYELSRRGYIALPTNRNTPGFDIVVTSQSGLKHVSLQVKTLQNKANYWPINRAVPDHIRKLKTVFFIFARFIKKEERFECFIVPAKDVAKQIDGFVKDWYKENPKSSKPSNWTYGWWLRKGKEKMYLNRWDRLKLN